MPDLIWVGKKAVARHARSVPYSVVRDRETYPASSLNGSNLLLHADNLVGLKALLPRYKRQVRCIYIDPPYNTGTEDWVYNDAVNSPEIREWLGKVVGPEAQDLTRHDKWLCMMYPRILLLKEFLSRTGSFWMQLDDNEAHYGKVVCDEIFGRSNFVAHVVWQKRTSPDFRETISQGHDHILVYARDRSHFELNANKIPKSEEQLSAFKNPDSDPRGPWVSTDFTAQGFRPNQMYTITTPGGRTYTPPPGTCWKNVEEVYSKLVAEGRMWFGRDGNAMPRRKTYQSEAELITPWTWWTNEEVGHTQEAKKESKALFGGDAFPTPKPERLIYRILQIASKPSEIVLDSFAGSGTTGAVAHKMGRKWIMIEAGDQCMTHIVPRLKRVVDGMDDGGVTSDAGWRGGGSFSLSELGPPLIDETGWIPKTVKYRDLARFVFFLETGSPLPRQSPEEPPLLATWDGKSVYLLYNGVMSDRTVQGGNILTLPILRTLPPREPPRVVYASGCTLGKDRLAREHVTFRQLPYSLRVE